MDALVVDRLVAPRRPFNSPMESGLRLAVLLNTLTPQLFDIQRLIYLDYLLVHSGDIQAGPQSLHPAIPHRSGEWLVRRDAISRGLDLMFSRELIDKRLTNNGIRYGANELTAMFVGRLTTSYAKQLQIKSEWIRQEFTSLSDAQLASLMLTHIDRWGAEFTFESVIRGIPQ